MQDAVTVCFGQGVNDVHRHRQRLAKTERTPAQSGLERLAIHVLHRDEEQPVGFAHFVHGADVGMVERGGGARFANQPGSRVGVGRCFCRKELQRNMPAELGVVSEVDLAHPARPEPGADFVTSEPEAFLDGLHRPEGNHTAVAVMSRLMR